MIVEGDGALLSVTDGEGATFTGAFDVVEAVLVGLEVVCTVVAGAAGSAGLSTLPLGAFAPDREPGLAVVNSVFTGPQNDIRMLACMYVFSQ